MVRLHPPASEAPGCVPWCKLAAMGSPEVKKPVVQGWLDWVMPQSVERFREHVQRVGDPVIGLAGPLATEGKLGGPPTAAVPSRSITLSYVFGGRRIDVMTAKSQLGGTVTLVHIVIEAAVRPKISLPFSLTVDERLIMLSIGDGRAQFRVVEASTGHWVAAGGWKKRHLRLHGSPGTSPDSLALTEVVLP